MKHVFVVQSSITELSVSGVIKILELKKSDVLLVTIRKYKLRLLGGYAFIEDDCAFESVSGLGIADLFCIRGKVLKIFESWRQSIVDYYILYVPQISSLYFQILAKSGRCVEVNYIEEGLGSRSRENINKKLRVRSVAKGLVRVIAEPAFEYVLKDLSLSLSNSFIDITSGGRLYLFDLGDDIEQDDYIVKMPIPSYARSDNFEDHAVIVIFSPFAYMGLIKRKKEGKFLKDKVAEIRIKYRLSKIYVKLHPMQKKYETVFDDSVELLDDKALSDFTILPDNAKVFFYYTSMIKYLRVANPKIEFIGLKGTSI